MDLSPPSPTLAILTAAQRRVIYCIAQGLSYEATAKRLGISYHTARHHAELAAARLPPDFYPAQRMVARLCMFYVLAEDKDQYQLVA